MVFENYMTLQIVFLLGVLLVLIRDSLVEKKEQPNGSQNYLFYLSALIVFIGVLFRVINPSYPAGTFIDGAMGAYDSWCLTHFQVDSNLASFPVYLKSWGTGQSALYAYLAAPFIKFLGLSVEVYRLPGAMLGALSIVVFYKMLRSIKLKPTLIFCLSSFVAINPWHIIKCRFAVDCNIFPDIFLIGVCLLIIAFYSKSRKQTIYYILGCILIGLSAYGYAVAWFMLPVFMILLMIYALRSKLISVRLCLLGFSATLLVAMPLLLFVLNLASGGEQYEFGPLTITALDGSRHSGTTIFGMDNILGILRQNFKFAFQMLVLGKDPDFFDTSIIFPYGLFYNMISLPFLVIGLYYTYKQRNIWSDIMAIWLISCLFILMFVLPNVNRWNTVWFPLIIFTAYGIYNIISKTPKWIGGLIFTIYLFAFLAFSYHYMFHYFPATFVNANTQAKEEIRFAGSKGFDKIYYPNNMDYAYVLFYSPIDPYVFCKTKVKGDDLYRFSMQSFANVEMTLPDEITPQKNVAYVIPNDSLNNINLSCFQVKKGEFFSVIWTE